jgi:flavin-binding protein dodecin
VAAGAEAVGGTIEAGAEAVEETIARAPDKTTNVTWK